MGVVQGVFFTACYLQNYLAHAQAVDTSRPTVCTDPLRAFWEGPGY